MKRMLTGLLMFVLLPACLPVLTFAEAAEEIKAYEISSADFPLFLGGEDLEWEMTLYFLEGANDLPYVDVRFWPEILESFLPCELSIDGSIAAFTRTNGYEMILDFEENTITFDDFDGFLQSDNSSSLLDLLSIMTENESGEPVLFQKNTDFSFDRYGDELVLRLGDYGIDLIEQDGLYLVPLQTLTDFTIAVRLGLNLFFNGQCLILNQDGSLADSPYYEAPTGERSAALCQYGYGELCLMLDHLYGLKDAHDIDSFANLFSSDQV